MLKNKKKDSAPPYIGGCLCGSIQYEVKEIGSKMAHCHCSMCQKFHGAAFSTFGEAKKENFRWIIGEHLLASYIAKNGTERQFCRNCGSSMTFKASEGQEDVIEFSLATLDSQINMHPDAHVFVSSRVSWFTICDELPQYLEGRGSPLIGDSKHD